MLNTNMKKLVLSFHITFVSIWIGSVIILFFIQSGNFLHNFPNNLAVSDKIIFSIYNSIVMNISIAVAITGLAFSAFTHWGFLKYWWIILKWIIIILLSIIVIISAAQINGAVAISDVLGQNAKFNADYLSFKNSNLLSFYSQLLLLIFTVALSVLKPWGKRKVKRVINRKLIISVVFVLIGFLTLSFIMQYSQLEYYRNVPIKAADIPKLKDGTYSGTSDFGFIYKVQVKLTNHKIVDIKTQQNRNSHYAKLAEGVYQKILNTNRNDVDTVTGATTTSKALLKAIENALIKENK